MALWRAKLYINRLLKTLNITDYIAYGFLTISWPGTVGAVPRNFLGKGVTILWFRLLYYSASSSAYCMHLSSIHMALSVTSIFYRGEARNYCG